jgi:hypothetical protein
MGKKTRHHYVYRDAGTGRFISKAKAMKRARDTWVRERR